MTPDPLLSLPSMPWNASVDVPIAHLAHDRRIVVELARIGMAVHGAMNRADGSVPVDPWSRKDDDEAVRFSVVKVLGILRGESDDDIAVQCTRWVRENSTEIPPGAEITCETRPPMYRAEVAVVRSAVEVAARKFVNSRAGQVVQ